MSQSAPLEIRSNAKVLEPTNDCRSRSLFNCVTSSKCWLRVAARRLPHRDRTPLDVVQFVLDDGAGGAGTFLDQTHVRRLRTIPRRWSATRDHRGGTLRDAVAGHAASASLGKFVSL